MLTLRLIAAYETTRKALDTARDAPTLTDAWRAHQDADFALLDHVRWHGPVFCEGVVYAASGTGLLVVRGVRVAEEAERS